MGLDTSLKDSQYALKNAFIYTILIALILLAPLYIYTVYMKSIYEVQNELLLKQRSTLILSAMEEFDETREDAFEYPRFKSIESGLYDLHFEPIFSLITKPIAKFSPGYHIYDDHAYLIVSLPAQRYFDAEYMIIANSLSYASLYQRVSIILLSIVILVFTLSFVFLDLFSQPFKRVNEKLDNFIKDSMHEINTPLSIINVNIDLYNQKYDSSKYLQRIKAATKTLSNIYNDMDYLIKNKKLDFIPEAIDLKAFMAERISYFDEVAAMKNIVIVSDLDDDMNIFFNTTQLQRIIDNNLSNAIKYSYEESSIEVALKRDESGIRLMFTDHGVGIADSDKIFERYYREETGKGGFGIGLNIVRSIMDEAGIGLEVISQLKKGSTFIYTFPRSISINKHFKL